MTFNNDTMVEECLAGSDNVPKVSYNLVPLSQIAQMEANAIVGKYCSITHQQLTLTSPSIKDVAGVCRDVGDVLQFTAKASGRELKKRDITLVDRSGSAVCKCHARSEDSVLIRCDISFCRSAWRSGGKMPKTLTVPPIQSYLSKAAEWMNLVAVRVSHWALAARWNRIPTSAKLTNSAAGTIMKVATKTSTAFPPGPNNSFHFLHFRPSA